MPHNLIKISLVSLSLNESCQKSHNSHKEYSSKDYRASLVGTSSYISKLWTICRIINLNKRQKKRIVSILHSYSTEYHCCQENDKLTACKYMQRFIYKYMQCNKSQFKDQVKKMKELKSKNHNTSILSLYLLYKILKTSDQFSACRKFAEKNIDHICFLAS